MKNIWREHTGRSITFTLCLLGALCSIEIVAHAQSGTCDVVQGAYKKTFRSGSNMSIKSGAGVDVTKAQGEFTSDASYQESCKYLRDENVNG